MSKLESTSCRTLFANYDLIFLSEIKCTYPFSLQGFHCIRSEIIAGEENRGGVAVLIKNSLWNKVYDVQRKRDQVWLRLDFAKDILFGAIYIPPRDSPYFSQDSFAQIHDMIYDNNSHVIMLGDFNARIKNLDIFNDETHGISYSQNVDVGNNTNGRDLIDLCTCYNLKPINHLMYKKVSI